MKYCKCNESCPIHHAPVVINTEMLQMLKDMVHEVGNTEGTLPHKTWLEAKALIAKAEGA